ncbi:MAG: hypothetical protein R3Y36_06075 [Spirochaetales bacterium]
MQKKLCIFLSIIFCFLLCISCGLNVFYEIDPPINAAEPNPSDGTTTSIISFDPSAQEFEFTARNVSSTFIAPGTDVYYRIYGSISSLQSDAAQINTSNTENTSNGFNKMTSLNYQKITVSSSTQGYLIDENGGRVAIRLFVDSTTSANYEAGIRVDGNNIGVPTRFNGNLFNFDTGDTAGNDYENPLPQSGDADYNATSDGNNYWYVNAYAVSVGLENGTFTQVRSELLPLGFVVYRR